jgi:general nucleoside transport system ATP-binding protein
MTETASSLRNASGGNTESEVANPHGPLLELSGIEKRFPGVLANDDVALSIRPGEIHALLGENGAGKSTLVKIICGVLHPDAGSIRWQGELVAIANPAAARRLGIGVVFQHFSLFDGLTAAENIALGIDDAAQRRNLKRRIATISAEYGLSVHPDRAVHDLSVGERQRIEIVRALLQDPKLLIMDEPTSVLTPQEVEQLFLTLRRLAAEGRAILYISHKLEEITALCQRATVMRLGRVVAECDPRRETARRLAELMVGRELKTPQRQKSPDHRGAARLVVNDLSLRSEERFGTDLKEIALTVSGGEILGIAGVAGNGQAELMAVLTGETLADSAAAILIDGTPAGRLGPAARRRLGAAFVPEERNGHGAVGEMTLAENAFLSAHRRLKLVRHGLIDERGAANFADTVIRRFDVRTSGPDAKAGSLSGGNLQKFIVGREILQKPGVLVISQPSWGLDAGAATAVAQALLDLAEAGAAVLIISQDLDEILSLCDRIAVIHLGALSTARSVHDVTAEEIGLLMGGVNTAPEDEAARAHPA